MITDAYGCTVANRFGNLPDDDDTDPLDFISEVETEQEKKRKKKKEDEDKKPKQKKPGQKESQRERRVPITKMADPELDAICKQPVKTAEEDGAETKRASKMAAFGERRPKPALSPQEFSVPKPSNYQNVDLRGRGGGGRGRRGGERRGYPSNFDNFVTRGKREYDRHSSTGISPDEKRGGRGPWNWGCVEEPARCESM
ncbi:intracellular hyaluronan-binding protein 4.S-like [Stigmatopora nigra]